MARQNCQMTIEFDEGMELGLELELEMEPASPAHQPERNPEQLETSLQSENLSVFSHRGKRSSNLDRFDWHISQTFQLYAVYDGHVTSTVSDYLKQHLLQAVASALSVGADFAQAAREGFAQMEQKILALQSQTEQFIGGSTAVVCMVAGDFVFTANLGDSRAALVSHQGDVKHLNTAHNLNNPVENELVCSRGGLVIRSGNNFRLNGELCVSRSIGDAKYKNYLSAIPDISVHRKSDAQYLVLGSDGFWEEADSKVFRKMIRCQSSANTAENLYNSTDSRSRDNSTILCVKLIH